MSLDTAALNAIAIETRQCFLTEDAPIYLENLQKGLEKLNRGQPDYTALMHAAHSLKGGAGIAQLTSLSGLAHKLEDLLEILQYREFVDRQAIAQLLQQGVDEMAMVFDRVGNLPATSLIDIPIDLALLQTLEALLAVAKEAQAAAAVNAIGNGKSRESDTLPQPNAERKTISPLVKSALEKDLEACLNRTEKLLQPSASISETDLKRELESLVEECILLGETLDLPWLVRIAEPLEHISKQSHSLEVLREKGEKVVLELRLQRSQFLHPESQEKGLDSNEDNRDSEVSVSLVNSIIPDRQPTLAGSTDALTTGTDPTGIEAVSYLRIPSSRIERMASTVGELIIRHERLLRQQQQLGRTNRNLRSLVMQLAPLQDSVQTLYDRLAIAAPTDRSKDSAKTGLANSSAGLKRSAIAELEEFDSLELDRYTSTHTSLQGLQEILVRIRETRADIDLSHRELGEEIDQLRQDLDRLYADLTQSRLVPFKTLAHRFVPQLSRLCQRYGKKVELLIQGEEVLVDRAILEQLQTPLNHLLLNAFDHGIESPEERADLGKPETASILLEATISDNQVTIVLKDDGSGIDLAKVHKRAVERGICPSTKPMGQWRREEILNFIFQPGFSTAKQVSDISGRGMGLDIVRSQITRLRGSVQVETQQGKGTTFTIGLPLGSSLLSLLICSLGSNFVAVPASSVLDILLYSELEILEADNSNNGASISQIKWRQQSITLLPLKELLPYSDRAGQSALPKVCIVLSSMGQPLAVTLDGILEERQLILKPFDDTVPVPTYIAGCTILGTGKAVPVLMPNELGTLLQTPRQTLQSKLPISPPSQFDRPADRTILVVEDSIATRKMLERLLKESGYTVISCRDGQEAIEELTRCNGKVDLAISDIEMPRVNGFSLLQAIRTHDSWYAIPVMMLTSRTGDRHRQKAKSLGASGYLSKPIVPAELLSSITAMLQFSTSG